MIESRWRTRARRVIAAAIASVGPDADLDTKRRAISAAYPFGERDYWPYKIWLDEARRQLGVSRKTKREQADDARLGTLAFHASSDEARPPGAAIRGRRDEEGAQGRGPGAPRDEEGA